MSDSVYNTSLKESSGTNLKIHDSYTEVLKSTDNAKLTLSNGVIVFTDDKKLFIHDGETLGGVEFYNAETSYELFNPSLRNPDGNIVVGNNPIGDVNKTTIYGESGQVVINSESNPALSVTGNTTLNGATKINAPLVVGDSEKPQKFTVYGDETITGISNLQGHTTIGLIEPDKPANLIVTGISHLYGDTTIGLFDPDKPANFIVTGNTTLNKTLSVTGNTSLPKAKFTNTQTTLSAPTQINNTLTVTGTTELKTTTIGASGATADLTVNGGKTTLNSTLNVSGATTLNNTLTVSGKTTLKNTLIVNPKQYGTNTTASIGLDDYSNKGFKVGTTDISNGIELGIMSHPDSYKGACMFFYPTYLTTNYSKTPTEDISKYAGGWTIGCCDKNPIYQSGDKRQRWDLRAIGPSGNTDANGNPKTYAKLSFSGEIFSPYDITGLSDIRTKTNIKKIDNALDKVNSLNGYTFNKLIDGNVSEERYTGCIAQEVQKVLPEAVGNNEEYLTLSYGNMVGLLIEAIKELKAEIEELKKDK